MTTWAFGHCTATSSFSLRVNVFFKTPNGSAQWSDLGRPSLVHTPTGFLRFSHHTFPACKQIQKSHVVAEPMGGGAALPWVDFAP